MKKQLFALTALLGVLVVLLVALRRFVLALVFRLPLPRCRVRVQYGLRITMRDGVRLVADHYVPLTRANTPTILIRSPYGRNLNGGFFGWLMSFAAQRFAERGYHVVVQDTRGRFESEGEFEPYFNERADGLATLDWLKQQPWFNGVLGMWGPSYLGIVQWTISDAPEVKALVPSVTSSQLHQVVFPDGAFDLGLILRWLSLFRALDRYKNNPLAMMFTPLLMAEMEAVVRPALRKLPVLEADAVALGKPVAFYREWMQHAGPNDPIWKDRLQSVDLTTVNAPTHLIGGWYDFFLRGMLDDYAALKAAGKTPYLTIGPWYHFSHMFIVLDTLKPGILWFDQYLKGDSAPVQRAPVRLYVMGANEWREMETYPPRQQMVPYYLGGEQTLSPALQDAQPDSYRYDPKKPTPILGGTQFQLIAGAMDNRRLERRSDVLTYTTAPLEAPLEIIGAVRLELYAASSLEHTDFFGRLCDVYPDGRSINICDGLFRLEPGKGARQPDGTLCLDIDLWATAYRFRKGHRIRLQVSSGAHPRWSRNLGVADSLLGTEMRAADQKIYHDRAHPSALVLPVVASHHR